MARIHSNNEFSEFAALQGGRDLATSVVVASSPDGTAHRSEDRQNEPDRQQNEADRPQDRDLRDEPDNQQQDAKNDHDRSLCDVTQLP
jgi:hypothetical protein